MRALVSKVFLQHPASVEETYFQHLVFAFGFSFRLFRAAFAALVHAFIPCLCEKTASTEINHLHHRMHNR